MEGSAGDHGMYLIDDLPVDRHAGIGVNLENNRIFGHVYQYSNTLDCVCQGASFGPSVILMTFGIVAPAEFRMDATWDSR